MEIGKVSMISPHTRVTLENAMKKFEGRIHNGAELSPDAKSIQIGSET
jgi:hypothetical protein